MQKPYKIQIDLYDDFIRDTHVNYIANDAETMPLSLQLLSHGEPVPLLDGDGVRLNFENPQGARFARSARIIDNALGEVFYEIQDGDIAIAGDMTASVTLVRGEKRLSWHGFKFAVTESRADGQTAPPEANAIRGSDFFVMSVSEDGNLIMEKNSDVPPPISINENGHLIYSFE